MNYDLEDMQLVSFYVEPNSTFESDVFYFSNNTPNLLKVTIDNPSEVTYLRRRIKFLETALADSEAGGDHEL